MMWKEYSMGYLKANRAASLSLMAAVLTASAFLSLVTGLFYNLWADSVWRVRQEEGDWHAAFEGEFTAEEIQIMENFSNVQEVRVFREEGNAQACRAELILENPRSVYEDMPLLAEKLSIHPEDTARLTYHSDLLLPYLIYSPVEREDPPLLLPLYILVMLVSAAALLLIIYSAFEVTGSGRLHQLGMLQSVGASPGQVRMVLLQEAAALSLPAVLAGILLGNGLVYVFLSVAGRLGDSIRRQTDAAEAVFRYSPLVFWVSFGACVLTVFFSAGLFAGRLTKRTILESLKGGEEAVSRKMRKYRLFSAVFGVEGELAQKSLYARRKAFRPAVLSLTLSFLAFSLFMNFVTLSDISTRETYFERNEDVWDVMLTTEPGIEAGKEEQLAAHIREIPGAAECMAYQVCQLKTTVPEELLSSELLGAGGLEGLSGVEKTKEGWQIPVLLFLLDEESFAKYRKEMGLPAEGHKALLVNRIWDSRNSHFREKTYLPYLKEMENITLELLTEEAGNQTEVSYPVKISVEACVAEEPVMRKNASDYGTYMLCLVMPGDACPVGALEPVFYQILAEPREGAGAVYDAVQELMKDFEEGRDYTLEDRQAEAAYNQEVWAALKLLYGGICVMLAVIGFANIFANMLGQTVLRRKEFARYQTVGMTPAGVWKTLLLEGAVLAGRPILIGIPVTAVMVMYLGESAQISMEKYLAECPVLPMAGFTGMFFLVTLAACVLGGRQILKGALVEGVRDEMI